MMAAFSLVSIIVPALNEAQSLPVLFERTAKALADQPFEFLVIDDGSTDETIEALSQLRARHPNIGFLQHFRNHGKSLALMQGFRFARGEVAVTLDADLQDHPEAIPAFLAKISEGYDLVNGLRIDRHDPPSKILVSRVFNFLTARFANCPLHDINCGFKAMTRRVFSSLRLRGDLHRLIPAIASSNGFKITEIPVPHSERKYGESRYRLFRHRGLLDIIALAASNSTQIRPFHAFSEFAACFWGASLLLFSTAFLLRRGEREHSSFGVLGAIASALAKWSVFVGTLLPLFGFNLEIATSRQQDEKWRESLLREIALPNS